MRFTFRHLEYFVAVVNGGTITRAAEKLCASPSSISAAITHLEDEFKVQLFVRRHARGLSLTREGERFLREVRTVIKQVNNLDVIAGALSEEIVGPLDVGCLTNFASIVLSDLGTKFQEIYPRTVLQFHFLYGGHNKLMDGLRRGEIELALTFDFEIPHDIVFTPLVALPTYVLMSADNPLAKKKKISLSELENEPFIQWENSPARELASMAFHLKGVRPNIAYTSRQYMFIRTLVGNDMGFTFINIRPKAQQALDGSKLVTIPLAGSLHPLTLGIATLEAPSLSPSLQAFADFCSEYVSERSIPGALEPGA